MQLRLATLLTSEDHVACKGWEGATRPRCPWHPRGSCGFKRHGTYARVHPVGARVARFYCPGTGRTLSLLPDCFAARRTGSLDALEAEVLGIERAASLSAAAAVRRPDIELPGALRWLGRARADVHSALGIVRALLPDRFEDVAPRIAGFAVALGLEHGPDDGPDAVPGVLRTLRGVAAAHLAALPAPLGFTPSRSSAGRPVRGRQHRAGRDPPPDDDEARALPPPRKA